MVFRVPTFNLLCRIGFTALYNVVPVVWRLSDVPCNLAFGRRVNFAGLAANGPPAAPTLEVFLLLPKLTDVRSNWQQPTGGFDGVEVPQGSGRFYWVSSFDDSGKGFANEHRVAMLVPMPSSWPIPAP